MSAFNFTDRAEAGRRLAAQLATMGLDRPVVYALPRGGVPVALEIARALDAPLDLILVRKIGAPGAPEVALGAVVDGEPAHTVVNERVRTLSGADDAFLERSRRRELAEIERRRERYLGDRARVPPQGRCAIVVDDGLATGATAKAALEAVRRQGAARIVLAIPVAPESAVEEMRAFADDVVCLLTPAQFHGVGAFYEDFHQLTDAETIGLLRQAWAKTAPNQARPSVAVRRQIVIPPVHLAGDLSVPADARGLVIFAHGSGSSKLSPRNVAVAQALNDRGFATLLFDLLTEAEARDRRNVFDVPLLAERLLQAVRWIDDDSGGVAGLPLGLFGASTGAAAALTAAAWLGVRAGAVVSRGGRPDLAGPALTRVTAPTLLIVGGDDRDVLELNRGALAELTGEKLLRIVPGAGHLFEEPGAMDVVIDLAGAWFQHYLTATVDRPAAPRPRPAVEFVRDAAELLPAPEDPAFANAFDRFGAARVVLLGEASHGTSEFYRARATITRRLIQKHGFSIVAVEADWPDAAAIDRHVRFKPRQAMQTAPFSRFPTWMWRNTDVRDFVDWLRRRNESLDPTRRAGFFGLDLYNMTASMAAVLDYLDRIDPEAARLARERYACLTPWSREPAAYGRASLTRGYALCEKPVSRILIDLLRSELEYAQHDVEGFFDAAQNARLVADAERYYRAMYYGAHESWNLRDQHMFQTLEQILRARGPDAKAVVWAHNSHIGDARFTEMGTERGELNIGQLCRQRFGNEAVLIGFGTHTGTVAAASNWDEPMEVKTVRPSRPDSYEAVCHDTGYERFLLDLREGERDALRESLAAPRLQRFIGVIYRPETERWSHYSETSLPDQFDAYVWFDETRAVTPLVTRARPGEEETYPFGL
jgi:erythromycin esterase-like protein/predicted phosphoribosyltransferase/dienelactone hydrolase